MIVDGNENYLMIKIESLNEDCFDSVQIDGTRGLISKDNKQLYLIPKSEFCSTNQNQLKLVFKNRLLGVEVSSDLAGLKLTLNYNASSTTLTLSTHKFDIFPKCESLNLYLLCYSEGRLKVTKPINVQYGKYVADNSIQNLSCKVSHFGLESNLEFVGSDLAEASSLKYYGLVGIPLFLIICLVAAFLVWTLKRNPKALTLLKFNRRPLKQNIDSALQEDQVLKEEFFSIENISLNEIYKKETFLVGKNPENRKRNRYNDIIPFDSNIVTLSEKTGKQCKF